MSRSHLLTGIILRTKNAGCHIFLIGRKSVEKKNGQIWKMYMFFIYLMHDGTNSKQSKQAGRTSVFSLSDLVTVSVLSILLLENKISPKL